MKKILLATVLSSAAYGFCQGALSDEVRINLTVACNGNGACEEGIGENRLNCAADCQICDNNGTCDDEWGETSSNCGADCGICDNNGDCAEDLGENETNCPADCLPTGCNGNGICEAGREENETNCPADCPLPGSEESVYPGQKAALAEISDIEISQITLMSGRLSWKTDILARCQVFFGENSDYRSGVIHETIFSKEHFANIVGLEPDTAYHFAIICTNKSGGDSRTSDGEFFTMALPDNAGPANVSNFTVVLEGDAVRLNWENPFDIDFAGVKILRSEKFFPQDLVTGRIIYDGSQVSASDSDIVAGNNYYYTAFAYDRSGNYSSGAVAMIEGEKVPGETAIIGGEAPAEIEKIDFSYFNFMQGGRQVEMRDGWVSADHFQPFTISIPYDKVPEVLKTIMVTIVSDDGKSFSFLLRVNRDKTAYEAVLMPPKAGEYRFDIKILDYKNRLMKKIGSGLRVIGEASAVKPSETIIKKYIIVKRFPLIIYIILMILAIWAVKNTYKKMKEKKKIASEGELGL